MKVPDKRELQQVELNHLSGIDFKYFIKIYNKCIAKAYSTFVNDKTSDNPLRFRKNLLK